MAKVVLALGRVAETLMQCAYELLQERFPRGSRERAEMVRIAAEEASHDRQMGSLEPEFRTFSVPSRTEFEFIVAQLQVAADIVELCQKLQAGEPAAQIVERLAALEQGFAEDLLPRLTHRLPCRGGTLDSVRGDTENHHATMRAIARRLAAGDASSS